MARGPLSVEVVLKQLSEYKEALQRKDWQRCVLLMTDLIDQDATKAQFYLKRASPLLKLCRWAEVSKDANKAIELQDLPEGHLYKGRAAFEIARATSNKGEAQRWFRISEDAFRVAVKKNPELRKSEYFVPQISDNVRPPLGHSLPKSVATSRINFGMERSTAKEASLPNQDAIRSQWLLSDLVALSASIRREFMSPHFDVTKLVKDRRSVIEFVAAFQYLLRHCRSVVIELIDWAGYASKAKTFVELQLVIRSLSQEFQHHDALELDSSKFQMRSKEITYTLLHHGDTFLSLVPGTLEKICVRLVMDCLQGVVPGSALWVLSAYADILKSSGAARDGELVSEMESYLANYFSLDDLLECSEYPLTSNLAMSCVRSRVCEGDAGLEPCLTTKIMAKLDSLSPNYMLERTQSTVKNLGVDLEATFAPWLLVDHLRQGSQINTDSVPTQCECLQPNGLGKSPHEQQCEEAAEMAKAVASTPRALKVVCPTNYGEFEQTLVKGMSSNRGPLTMSSILQTPTKIEEDSSIIRSLHAATSFRDIVLDEPHDEETLQHNAKLANARTHFEQTQRVAKEIQSEWRQWEDHAIKIANVARKLGIDPHLVENIQPTQYVFLEERVESVLLDSKVSIMKRCAASQRERSPMLSLEQVFYVRVNPETNHFRPFDQCDASGCPWSLLGAPGLFVSQRCALLCHKYHGRETVLLGNGWLFCECGLKGWTCRHACARDTMWLPKVKMHHKQSGKISPQDTIEVMDFRELVMPANTEMPSSVSKKKRKKKKKKTVASPEKEDPELISSTVNGGGPEEAVDDKGSQNNRKATPNSQELREDQEFEIEGRFAPCNWPGTAPRQERQCLVCKGIVATEPSKANSFFEKMLFQEYALPVLKSELANERLSEGVLDRLEKQFASKEHDLLTLEAQQARVQNTVDFLGIIGHLFKECKSQINQFEGKSRVRQTAGTRIPAKQPLSDKVHQETLRVASCANYLISSLSTVDSSLGFEKGKLLESLRNRRSDGVRLLYYVNQFQDAEKEACEVRAQITAQENCAQGTTISIEGTSALKAVAQSAAVAGRGARELEQCKKALHTAEYTMQSASINICQQFASLLQRISEDILVAAALVKGSHRSTSDPLDRVEECTWREFVDSLLRDAEDIPRHEVQTIQWRQDQFLASTIDQDIELSSEELKRITTLAQSLEKVSEGHVPIVESLLREAQSTLAAIHVLTFNSATKAESASLDRETLVQFEGELRDIAKPLLEKARSEIVSGFSAHACSEDLPGDISDVHQSCMAVLNSTHRDIERTEMQLGTYEQALGRTLSLRFGLFYSLCAFETARRCRQLVQEYRATEASAELLLIEESGSRKSSTAQLKRSKKKGSHSQEDLGKAPATPQQETILNTEDDEPATLAPSSPVKDHKVSSKDQSTLEEIKSKGKPKLTKVTSDTAKQAPVPVKVEISTAIQNDTNTSNDLDRPLDKDKQAMQSPSSDAASWILVSGKKAVTEAKRSVLPKRTATLATRARGESVKDLSKKPESLGQRQTKSSSKSGHPAKSAPEALKSREDKVQRRTTDTSGTGNSAPESRRGNRAPKKTGAKTIVKLSQQGKQEHLAKQKLSNSEENFAHDTRGKYVKPSSTDTFGKETTLENSGLKSKVISQGGEEVFEDSLASSSPLPSSPCEDEEMNCTEIHKDCHDTALESVQSTVAIDNVQVEEGEGTSRHETVVQELHDGKDNTKASEKLDLVDSQARQPQEQCNQPGQQGQKPQDLNQVFAHHQHQHHGAPHIDPFQGPYLSPPHASSVPMYPRPVPIQMPIQVPSHGPPPRPTGICKFFLDGSCRFGPRCRDRHLTPIQLHDELMAVVQHQHGPRPMPINMGGPLPPHVVPQPQPMTHMMPPPVQHLMPHQMQHQMQQQMQHQMQQQMQHQMQHQMQQQMQHQMQYQMPQQMPQQMQGSDGLVPSWQNQSVPPGQIGQTLQEDAQQSTAQSGSISENMESVGQ